MKRAVAAWTVAMILACAGAPTAPSAPAQPKPRRAPELTKTCDGMAAEGKEAVAANYKGKVVRVSGMVDRPLGGGAFDLAGGTHICQMFPAAGEDHPSRLRAGDSATYDCTSAGWSIGPRFEECWWVDPAAGGQPGRGK